MFAFSGVKFEGLLQSVDFLALLSLFHHPGSCLLPSSHFLPPVKAAPAQQGPPTGASTDPDRRKGPEYNHQGMSDPRNQTAPRSVLRLDWKLHPVPLHRVASAPFLGEGVAHLAATLSLLPTLPQGSHTQLLLKVTKDHDCLLLGLVSPVWLSTCGWYSLNSSFPSAI